MKAHKTKDRVSEESIRYGRTPRKPRRKRVTIKPQPIKIPDDVQWMISDAQSDGHALIKMINFLEAHGLRKDPSACDSAIRAITELSDEVAKLKAALARTK